MALAILSLYMVPAVDLSARIVESIKVGVFICLLRSLKPQCKGWGLAVKWEGFLVLTTTQTLGSDPWSRIAVLFPIVSEAK